jgi:potassium-transporting ATPase KdpC subunit
LKRDDFTEENMLKKAVLTSTGFLIWITLLTGLVYPLAISILGKGLFPYQSEGSLVQSNESIVGSELIGQEFSSDKYFHSRPSATTIKPYNSQYSGGSNLSISGDVWKSQTLTQIQELLTKNKEKGTEIPIDLVTASGSGLDPHISIGAAHYHAQRVANSRGVPLSVVEKLISEYTTPPDLGFLGEPRVNVLLINLALDELQ